MGGMASTGGPLLRLSASNTVGPGRLLLPVNVVYARVLRVDVLVGLPSTTRDKPTLG